jgi:crotonobetainyl-CoA:carnitine CoA-transferase CaiB-like acyl-CoA transferase
VVIFMQHKPLTGIRILELGGYISLPYATSMLSALGADVVKVEKPGTGDDFRRGDNDRSPNFIQHNAGKRSLSVDLKSPAGVALVKALIPRFDVLVENLRPGKLAAIGLSRADCAALRPDLVYGSLTGFGNGGPLAQRPAYDTIGQSFGGLYSLSSNAGTAQLSGTIFAESRGCGCCGRGPSALPACPPAWARAAWRAVRANLAGSASSPRCTSAASARVSDATRTASSSRGA